MKLSLKPDSQLKPIFGAYAAMARNNIFLTVLDVMKQLHIPQEPLFDPRGNELDLEANIWKLSLFVIHLKPEQSSKADKLLRTHFPFLDLLNDIKKEEGNIKGESFHYNVSFKDTKQLLLNGVNVLSHLRDINLHYKTNDGKINDYYYRKNENDWSNHLIRLLKAAPRVIKERYKQTSLLSPQSMDFFTKDSYLKNTDGYILNPDWLFCPKRKPGDNELYIYKDKKPYRVEKERFDRLTRFGEILTIALFIERRYISDFLSECGLLGQFPSSTNDGSISQRRLLKELISVYCIHLPNRRLDISIGETQIKLDMLNELAKCPDELYKVLPDTIKTKFEIIGIDGRPVFMKRYSDRYPALLLNYFDTTGSFEKLRFQVNAGYLKYVHHGITDYMDGVGRVRIIQDGLNCFGRRHEVESKLKEQFSIHGFPVIRNNEEEANIDYPFITESGTRYVFNGDMIGISLNGDIMPRIEQYTDNNTVRYRVRNTTPDCWISKYELPAMAFYHYLSKKYNEGVSVEQLLSQTTEQYRKFFQGVSDGTIKSLSDIDIPIKAIPQKLHLFLKGESSHEDYNKFKERVISKMIEETDIRLSRLKDNLEVVFQRDNKIGKKTRVRLKPGVLSDYLAKDIVRFQSFPDNHPEKKMTGQQFSILQGLIATFSEELEVSCKRAGLLDGPSSHPFLSRVFSRHRGQMRSTIDFYQAYLEERRAYLSGSIPDDAHFLHPNRVKWSHDKQESYFRSLSTRYIKDEITGERIGIFLPRGLFLKPALKIIANNCPKTARFLEEQERINMSFLILTYLEEELQDQNQGYYYDHFETGNGEYDFYKIIDREKKEFGDKRLGYIIRAERDSCQNSLYFFQLKNAFGHVRESARPIAGTKELAEKLRAAYNKMCKNEKKIRQYMIQDATLFLLSRDVVGPAGGQMKLADIDPTGNSVLEQTVDVTTNYKGKTIRQRNVKVKNYGELYSVLSDKRINTLLEYQPKTENSIPLEAIKEELVSYDHERVPVITKIQGYERAICEEKPELFSDEDARYDFNDIQNADTKTPNLNKVALKKIRNAFSHNQYPAPVVKQGNKEIVIFTHSLPDVAREISSKAGELTNWTPEEGPE